MTIIIDPSIVKGQGSRQPSPPPSQPPPSYTESAATQPLVVQPGTSSISRAQGYGPTPIGRQQQAALPYYDPQSVYSVQGAKRRARERFVGAVLWVLLIFALLSVLAWMDVMIQLGWSVSCCALLRTEPYRPLPSSRRLCTLLNVYYLVLLVISRRTYVDSRHVASVFSWRKGSVQFIVRWEGTTKKNYVVRRNHRERVVDHPDDRVEFSRHTLFSLPVLLVPNDNNDHYPVPLPVRLE